MDWPNITVVEEVRVGVRFVLLNREYTQASRNRKQENTTPSPTIQQKLTNKSPIIHHFDRIGIQGTQRTIFVPLHGSRGPTEFRNHKFIEQSPKHLSTTHHTFTNDLPTFHQQPTKHPTTTHHFGCCYRGTRMDSPNALSYCCQKFAAVLALHPGRLT